jgi:nucleoside-triphosphatase
MTTVIRKVADRLQGHRIGGFFTEEIRVEGMRQGFRMTTFDGLDVVFAHREIESTVRISGYGIDVGAIDRVVERAFGPAELYLIDEIAKMECSSEKFVAGVRMVLESGRPVVATVSLKGEGLPQEVKQRPDAVVWKVTRETRAGLPDRILGQIRSAVLPRP